MINLFTAIFSAFVWVLNVLTLWLPTVTQLPFGLDSTLVDLVGLIKGVVNAIPFLQEPFYIILTMITIVSTVFVWGWLVRIWHLFRG